MKSLLVILAAAIIVALPFVFRRPAPTGDWRAGDPVLVAITPHNEALRYEFAQAFSRWHRERYGRPVKLDWRVIGGTTEIMRYLASEYVNSCKAWRRREGGEWPADGAELILDRRFDPSRPPPEAATNAVAAAAFARRAALFSAFRGADDPAAVTSGIDLFFGGGTYDHDKAAGQGLVVPPWRGAERQRPEVAALLDAFPAQLGGEVWRSEFFFGNVLSTFGICCNRDRLADLRIEAPPSSWSDLADPRLFGEVGLADPTKSGSVAKAFEMIVHQQCIRAVAAAGFTDEQVAAWEAAIAKARLPPGQVPTNVPAAYQAAVERGWAEGINLLRLIGANARYFTDGAGKVPVDVSAGFVAAGVAIDFYGHFQAETERAPDGAERMLYITPAGGTSVSADPISLLRGAPHRELAVRFIEFVLGPDGQKLWNFRPGAPGGPVRFALRRLPIRRDFYPSDDPAAAAAYASNRVHEIDDFTDPAANPYRIAARFAYRPRWTAAHFGIQRDIVRAMCMDAGDELRAAWRAILDHGGPAANPRAMALLTALPDRPVPLDWRSAVGAYARADRLDYLRQWNGFFRARYREAQAAAEGQP
jgi:ABC-type Fe3+ transport system substrate-binding protein